jgi:hypothetical protein
MLWREEHWLELRVEATFCDSDVMTEMRRLHGVGGQGHPRHLGASSCLPRNLPKRPTHLRAMVVDLILSLAETDESSVTRDHVEGILMDVEHPVPHHRVVVRGHYVSGVKLPRCPPVVTDKTARCSSEVHAASTTNSLTLIIYVMDDSCCGLCDLQDVRCNDIILDHPRLDKKDTADKRTKHRIFHEPCTRCDDILLDDSVTLCDRCHHLRIPHIFSCNLQSYQRDGRAVTFIEVFELSREPREDCEFCLFMASSVDRLSPSDCPCIGSSTRVHIIPFHSIGERFLLVSTKPDQAEESRSATSSPSAFVHCISSGEDPRYIQPYINWSWLRKWSIRSNPVHEERLYSMPSLLGELQNVRAIDVLQKCVVDLPLGTKYLALSYVWGASGAGLQCKMANVRYLEQPGSLGDLTKTLPKTISDAMLVCEKLGYSFLWVDRLCIVQDHPRISEQLSQMAAIYHQAALTIVALEGDGASHGLSGISYPRDVDQLAFRYADNFQLLHETPTLETCLSKSVWHQRGWTYQEHMASSSLLFFTDHGLFLDDRRGGRANAYPLAEGPAYSISSIGRTTYTEIRGLRLIQEYSQRSLTFQRDKLRAVNGILQAMYNGQTTYGIPLSDFENGVIWEIDDSSKARESKTNGIFPTWSWASINGAVNFPICTYQDHFSLAYWAWAERSRTADRKSFQWSHTRDAKRQGAWSFEDHFNNTIKDVIALAWMHGCFYSEVPPWLMVDCSAQEWKEGVRARWSEHDLEYLKGAFQNKQPPQLFTSSDLRSLASAGRIISNTQISTFHVDWNSVSIPGPDGQYGIVRTPEGRFAGSVLLDEPSTQQLKVQEATTVEFIALALVAFANHDDVVRHDAIKDTQVPIGVLYGCPCSNRTAETQDSVHISECDKNTDSNPAFSEQENRRVDGLPPNERAYYRHQKTVSYQNNAGEFLHTGNAPEMKVMMIAPGPSSFDKGKVFQRLGIGNIYLKRWVESSPTFESVVLE